MPAGCRLRFEPFIAQAEHASLGLVPGNLYGQSTEAVDVDGACKRLIARPVVSETTGDIEAMSCHCPDGTTITALPTFEEQGNVVWEGEPRPAPFECGNVTVPRRLKITWPCEIVIPDGFRGGTYRFIHTDLPHEYDRDGRAVNPFIVEAHRCSNNVAGYGAAFGEGFSLTVWARVTANHPSCPNQARVTVGPQERLQRSISSPFGGIEIVDRFAMTWEGCGGRIVAGRVEFPEPIELPAVTSGAEGSVTIEETPEATTPWRDDDSVFTPRWLSGPAGTTNLGVRMYYIDCP